MPQTKATKHFEKRHLQHTLERRKGLKKTKQKQQIKARKAARRVEENGGAGKVKEEKAVRENDAGKDAFQDMTVDEFFQGGFELPEMTVKTDGKRKRGEYEPVGSRDMSEDEAEELDNENFDDDTDDDLEDQSKQLDAPAMKGADEDDNDRDEPKRKKQKYTKGVSDDLDSDSDSNSDYHLDLDVATRDADDKELSRPTVQKWSRALVTEHSLRAAREVVLAFRSAAHVSEANDDGKKPFKYTISDPDVYHLLLSTALTKISPVFEHHLPVQENPSGTRVHVATEDKKFKTIAPLLRSHVSSITHLLGHLSDAATLRLTLTSIQPLLPYLLSFKKLLRDLIRALSAVWSDSAQAEATRITSFLLLRRLVVIADAGIRDHVLKATYQALIQSSRNTTVHTLPGVNLMKNSAVELWVLVAGDVVAAAKGNVAYSTAFPLIRQLAVHLRGCIAHNADAAYRKVYNWQYMHALDFWSRVLSSACSDATSGPAAPLHPLIYPVVQLTLGTLRLIPTATYFPLRFQLVRSLLRLSRATSTYIPLAPALYEVLDSAEMRKPPRPSTLPPLDFACSIRASQAYLRTRVYQDGVGEQVAELLGEYFGAWARSVAFPELALPVTVLLKRWLKQVDGRSSTKGAAGNKNQKVKSAVSLLLQKLESQTRFVEERRAHVQFAPNDRKAVRAFLVDVPADTMPLEAFLAGQRKMKEERARAVEEGRKEEERRGVAIRKAKHDVEDEAAGGGEYAEEEEEDDDDDDDEEGSGFDAEESEDEE